MNKGILNNLIKSFDVFDIERALVSQFCNANNLLLQSSPILNAYLADYNPIPALSYEVLSLGNYTIEELSVAFELLIPKKDRVLNGAFFTPAYIVDYIVESIAPKETETVIDLSCGCGAFLLGVIRYFIKTYNKPILSILSENIYGADILDYNIRRCRVLISLFALINKEVLSENNFNLICCDSLKHKWNQNFDCIVGNPPYVKFQDLEESTRKYLSCKWNTTSFGTFNLYFAFFELGYKLLSNNGRLGYITPNNYFTSLSGESLRAYFQQKCCIYKIIDFNAAKVFDVQTYTSITFINRQKNKTIEYGRLKNEQQPYDFLKAISFSENAYECLSEKKWRLLCDDEQHNIRQIETIGEPIGQLFNICVGIATLKDDVYSFYPVNEDSDFYYFKRDDKIWKVEKELTRSTVKISDMKSQCDIENNMRHFIFPYKTYSGKLCVVPEYELKLMYPECYAYFISVKDLLDGRGKGKHTYTPFYSYGRTQGLNRKGIKMYTPTFSKHPRFLIDLDEESLFTNGYGIYFRERNDNDLFNFNPIAHKSNLDVIQKILNSEIMNYYITATSVAIEGGYPCYQKNFIEKFTIPYLDDHQISLIRSTCKTEKLNAILAEIYQINLPSPNLV